MILDPYNVLAVSINTRGLSPCIEECREIIRQVSTVEGLIELFLNAEIEAEEYLDGVDDAGVDMDDYVEGISLWLPS
ncbi:hypothetical protein [Nostoc sp. FACHB-280]|uniref:hypothetical protein n=1 Tax=Nostoc sp. FACHB-280 TaxID=2692839 RepID=UPI00168AD40E|nr:hypothetical protein [Nostoc sp. FACHB-280]MBD2495003.1 hypothetical protein [Nostoc sp. FACHB-280]